MGRIKWSCPKCGQAKLPPRYNKCPECDYIIDSTFVRTDSEKTFDDVPSGNLSAHDESPEFTR